MNTETKILGGVLLASITIVVVFAFLAGKAQPANNQPAVLGQSYNIDYSAGQKRGPDTAKVKLVEFSDFQCPACLAAEPAVEEVIKKYPNDVQFIYRHFPLPQHGNSRNAANASEEASSQGKFWEMHDKLFATQGQWSDSKDTDTFFANLGKDIGIDGSKVKEAVDKNLYKDKIDADISAAYGLGVNSTPTFFLNGQKLSLQQFSDLVSAVDKEVSK